MLNPKVCAFPEASFGVSKRLQLCSSLGMEDAPQLAAGFFTVGLATGTKFVS
jgi:hypothetical protein